MNKRKETIFDECKDGKNSSLINTLQNYYRIKDIDENTNCLNIFNALYISKLSYDTVVAQFFISESTLRRYVKMFSSLAEKIEKSSKNERFNPSTSDGFVLLEKFYTGLRNREEALYERRKI